MKHISILLLTALFFTSCEKPDLNIYETLTIKEGQHRSRPHVLTWSQDVEKTYDWQFNSTARYELGDDDQADWNKLTGESADLATNHDNSLRVAWRYDRNDSIRLSFYYHLEGKPYWANAPYTDLDGNTSRGSNNIPHMTISVVEPFTTHIDVVGHAITMTIETMFSGQSISYTQNFPPFNRTREIHPWFGGNRSAPHDIKIGRRLTRKQ